MHTRLPVLILALACFATFATILSPAQAAGANVIKVGQAIDLSGPNGSIGRDYVAGITTYFDGINAKGGVNGRKIVYTARDDHGIPADSAKLAAELVRDERSDFLMGPIGVDAVRATLAAPAFAQSGHVLFAPLADSAGVPKGRVLFWRPGIESEFLFLLSYFQNLGIKDIGIAYQPSPHNDSAHRFLVAEIRKRGLNLTGVALISASPLAISGEAQRLAAKRSMLVITIADTFASAQFLRAFRAHDASTVVAGTSLTNLATRSEVAGARATEWTVFSQVVPRPESGATPLQSEHIALMKKFRDEPVSPLTLEGFAVAKTLVKAMQLAAGGQSGLQTMAARRTTIDLGGMLVKSADAPNNLSRFVDIALFQRGGGLMFEK